jgi:hypothetical protein
MAQQRNRPSNYETDPLLRGPDWENLKTYWRQQRGPCARCGGEIDYDTVPRYWKSLDVGHKTSRETARALDWTRAEINSVANTQPEHQRCSRAAGARQGNRSRRNQRAPRPNITRIITKPAESEEW